MKKSKIQGITIEIGGNTTELSNALKRPNEEVSNLQSKLRAVDQALKLDPTNTDLLAQKQRLLAEVIEKTENKLDLLKKAQEEFIDSGKDIDGENYIELERQIALTENSLKKLKKNQDDACISVQKMQKSMKTLGDGMEKAADKTKGLSAAAGGLLGTMVATVPTTQELREDLSKLDLNAQEAGVGIDIARAAFKEFNNVSGETNSSIEAISNLLQAGFTESNLQKAVEGLSGAALRFPDTLKIESLADSLQETIASGEATGQFAELLDRLGYGAENFSEQMESCSTEAERQLLALKVLSENGLTQTYELWKENNEELIKNKEASLEMQEAMGQLADVMLPIVNELIEAVTDLVQWFTSLSSKLQSVILIFLAVVAALSPFFSILSKIVTVVSTLLPYISKLAPIFTPLKTAIAAVAGAIKSALIGAFNLIMAHPIIAGIAAIIAIIIALYNKCEWFRDAVNEVISGLVEAVKQIINDIGDFLFVKIPEILGNILNFVGHILGELFSKTMEILSAVKDIFVNAFNKIGEFLFKTIPQIISDIINWFAELPGKIWNTLTKVVSNVVSWGGKLFSAGSDAAKKLLDSVVNGLVGLPGKILDIGVDLVKGLWNGISQMGGWLWDKITGWAGDILGGIGSFFGIHSPSTVMRDYIGKNLVAGMGEGIIENAKMALAPMKSLVNDMTSTILPDMDAQVTKTLNYQGTVTVEVPVKVDLDGKPIYNNVTRRITKNQSHYLAFQGG